MQDRHLDQLLSDHFSTRQQAIILLGPRQVGKTTILHKLFPKAKSLSPDNESVRSILERYDVSAYQPLLSTNQNQVIVDEIQKLSDPGRCAKIFYDQFPDFQFIFTGSSAYNIKNKTSESLAGRKIDYHLFPLTLSEYLTQAKLESSLSFTPLEKILSNAHLQPTIKPYDHLSILENLLIFGSYPYLLDHQRDELYLSNLLSSVVFKDLTELQLLENKSAAISLLRLLAHQIGSLVNYSELASRLNIDSRTVKRYMALFEQSYLIFTLPPYSQNPRDEIGKMPKVYFYDLGLRNTLVGNFAPLTSRADAGSLFENFVILDLYKYNNYGNFGYKFHYWRTKAGSEIDLVLQKNSDLYGIEIKYSPRRTNQAFFLRYPQATRTTLSQDNYWV